MIVEGKKPDYNDIIESTKMQRQLVCQHDFWDKTKFLDYGDIILCQRCSQYFAKVKHLICVVRGKEVLNPSPHIKKMMVKPKPNHKEVDVFVRVPVRVSDNNE